MNFNKELEEMRKLPADRFWALIATLLGVVLLWQLPSIISNYASYLTAAK
jgi:hypothetical protein